MDNKVSRAVDRLNEILPLKENQSSMNDELQKLHRDILYSYVDIGRSLNRSEISRRVKVIDDVIDEFQKKDLVVFSGNGEPIGAYPFTMQKRKHEITINGHLLHCMCALDSLAVSTMYDMKVEINSVCHLSGAPIYISQNGHEFFNLDEIADVFFGINWNAAKAESCCADSLCTEMIFIKGSETADNWYNEDTVNREVFALPDALKFASGFFTPLLQ